MWTVKRDKLCVCRLFECKSLPQRSVTSSFKDADIFPAAENNHRHILNRSPIRATLMYASSPPFAMEFKYDLQNMNFLGRDTA